MAHCGTQQGGLLVINPISSQQQAMGHVGDQIQTYPQLRFPIHPKP
jgi:hypothetical protein